MSYRSFKHVLGETSLERKCRFLFGGCLLLLITGSFFWYGKRTEMLVYENTRNTGRLLVAATNQQHHLVKFESLKDVVVGGIDYSDAAKELNSLLKSEDYEPQIINPDKKDPMVQPADALDRFAWSQVFPKTAPPGWTPDSKPEYWEAPRTAPVHGEGPNLPLATGEYRYYQAVRAKAGCIQCHELLGSAISNPAGTGLGVPTRLAEGDLMAVVRISMSDEEITHAVNKNRAILIATAIVTVFLAMVALYVIVRYVIVKPLKHLRDVSDEVSHGNTSIRAEIHTADEFEELGVAFNRMLRHLVDAHAELRHLNSDLDAKVDELAQANMRLYEMNRLKSDFLATMSHELRTPLNSIIGFSDVLGGIDSLNEKQKRYVQNIQKSGRMLLEMINDILDLAKIESGKMEVRLSDFRIAPVIAAQCDMARPLTEKKNIDLETNIEDDLPELFQDQGKVQQILNNLLSNAIKFTPEGGRIIVSAHLGQKDDLILTVEDTGVGIAEEDQVAIFEKFRQGRTAMAGGDAMTREYSGTGLGLSIVKELCKLLGGEITLESQLGQGSTFSVRLPLTRADQPKLESTMEDNLEELIRPRRIDFQRSLERPVGGATGRS